MADVIIVLIILAILAFSICYIVKEKKKFGKQSRKAASRNIKRKKGMPVLGVPMHQTVRNIAIVEN